MAHNICVTQDLIVDALVYELTSKKLENCIAIGHRADATACGAIAIGAHTKADEANEIRIGCKEGAKVTIGRYNIQEMFETLEELKSIVKKQSEVIDALWYHPGMPGANAAQKNYLASLANITDASITDANILDATQHHNNLPAGAQDGPNQCPHHTD